MAKLTAKSEFSRFILPTLFILVFFNIANGTMVPVHSMICSQKALYRKMDRTRHLEALLQKLPKSNENFSRILKDKSDILILEKNETLITFQLSDRKIHFIVSGSFIRNIITSRGEVKTVMFHTEGFCEFFKSYDTVYFHQKTNYEVKTNEKSIAVSIDFDLLTGQMKNDLELLRFYIKKTEEIFVTIDLFRNFQLGLTSEEYLGFQGNNPLFELFQKSGIRLESGSYKVDKAIHRNTYSPGRHPRYTRL